MYVAGIKRATLPLQRHPPGRLTSCTNPSRQAKQGVTALPHAYR